MGDGLSSRDELLLAHVQAGGVDFATVEALERPGHRHVTIEADIFDELSYFVAQPRVEYLVEAARHNGLPLRLTEVAPASDQPYGTVGARHHISFLESSVAVLPNRAPRTPRRTAICGAQPIEIRAQPGKPKSAPDRTTVPAAARAGVSAARSNLAVTKLAWLGKYSTPSRPRACSSRSRSWRTRSTDMARQASLATPASMAARASTLTLNGGRARVRAWTRGAEANP